jgi:type IV secretory pathway VirB2 component (pilin)
MFVDLSFLNSTGFSNLEELLYFLINYAISISVVLAVISLILAGFKYIFSIGDSKKIEDANRSLLFSLIGLVIVFIAPTVIEYVIKKVILGE